MIKMRGRAKKDVDLAVAIFFYRNGIAFHAVDSPAFKEMCTAIGSYGAAYAPPSSFPLRSSLLEEAKKEVDKGLLVCTLPVYT